MCVCRPFAELLSIPVGPTADGLRGGGLGSAERGVQGLRRQSLGVSLWRARLRGLQGTYALGRAGFSNAKQSLAPREHAISSDKQVCSKEGMQD